MGKRPKEGRQRKEVNTRGVVLAGVFRVCTIKKQNMKKITQGLRLHAKFEELRKEESQTYYSQLLFVPPACDRIVTGDSKTWLEGNSSMQGTAHPNAALPVR